MDSKITGVEQNIGHLYSPSYKFYIPPYQRGYAWTEEQAEDLVNDLYTAFQEDATNDYFLGSIVLVKKNTKLFDVVDGQQRLVSLSLLFSVIGYLAKDEKLKKSIQKLLLDEVDEYDEVSWEERIRLFHLDNIFFKEEVCTNLCKNIINEKVEPKTLGQKNMCQAVIAIKNSLEDKNLGDFYKYIRSHCYLILVTTADNEHAFRIFSVLNNRGIPLSQSDLIKATLLEHMDSPSDAERYASLWQNWHNRLGDKGMLDFIDAVILLKENTDYLHVSDERQTRLELIEKKWLKEESATTILNKYFLPYIDAIDSIYNEKIDQNEYYTDIMQCLHRIKLCKETSWQTVIAILFMEVKEPDRILKLLKEIETLVVYGKMFKKQNTSLVALQTPVIRDLEANTFAMDWVLSQEERAKMAQIIQGELYHRMPSSFISRYFCVVCASLIDKKDVLSYEEQGYIIRPLVLSNQSSFGWKEQSISQCEKRLGNLMLHARNRTSLIRSDSFEIMKTEFLPSHLYEDTKFNNDITTQSIWTPYSYQQRQTKLVNMLCDLWNLNKTTC